MFNKILAGIVMGLVIGLLCSIVFGIGSGGGAEGGKTGLWAAAAGFLIMMALALSAARGRYAWGRGLLLSGLLCFALPLAGIVFTGIVGADSVAKAGSEAGKAGAAVGSALAGTALTFVSGVIGFFLGLIFLVSSYFSLRRGAS